VTVYSKCTRALTFEFFFCQVLGIYSGDITGDGVREFVLVLEDGVRVLKVKK
jgi:hypothetical protein